MTNVQRLTVVVKEKSIAIDKLKLTTAGLSNRMDILETTVYSIIHTIGPVKKLNGTGIMQLPNGCTLSVTDKLGKTPRLKVNP
jgi:hypothetical protein